MQSKPDMHDPGPNHNPNETTAKQAIVRRAVGGGAFNTVLIKYTGPAVWRQGVHEGAPDNEGDWVRPSVITTATGDLRIKPEKKEKTNNGKKK